MLVTLVVMAIAIGTLVYLPPLRLSLPVFGIAAFVTLLDSLFTLHVFLAGVAGIALAWWARRLGGRRTATIVWWCAIVATAGSAVPLVALTASAYHYGAPISWTAHLNVAAAVRAARPSPDETRLFATVDGRELFADVYRPAGAPAASAPVVMIHGGAFVAGERSGGTAVWDRWLAARGYTVFDVDYRLAPPVTWNLAAADVACAMAWVASHAGDYHISPDRMLVSGQSAGGGLALQVAYGVGDGTVTSSCGDTVPQPKAVFAIYPAEDLVMAWDLVPGNHKAGNLYIGGSPQEFFERYRAVSPTFHVRPGLPATLIVAGTHDHVVPFEGHLEIVPKLDAAGVPNQLLSVPYGEHIYDVLSGSLGSQITRKVAADFLDKYLPAKDRE